MTEYVTVYTFSGQPSHWPLALAGLIPILVAGLLIAGKHRHKWKRPNVLATFVCCGLGWMFLMSGLGILKTEADAASALRDGTCSLVDGTVTDFHPMPYNGHEEERFSVRVAYLRSMILRIEIPKDELQPSTNLPLTPTQTQTPPTPLASPPSASPSH